MEQAEKDGATIACGKEQLILPEQNKNVLHITMLYKCLPVDLTLQGYFMRPTVITDVKDNSPSMTEEIFGTKHHMSITVVM